MNHSTRVLNSETNRSCRSRTFCFLVSTSTAIEQNTHTQYDYDPVKDQYQVLKKLQEGPMTNDSKKPHLLTSFFVVLHGMLTYPTIAWSNSLLTSNSENGDALPVSYDGWLETSSGVELRAAGFRRL